MKRKKKKDQSVDASILYRRWNKLITGGRGRKGLGRQIGRGEKKGGKEQERNTEG